MGEDVAEGHARDDPSGEAGRQIPADDQGLSADRTGVVLEPGRGVRGCLVSGGIAGREGLAVGEQFPASGVGFPFGTGIQAIVAHGLIMRRGHV